MAITFNTDNIILRGKALRYNETAIQVELVVRYKRPQNIKLTLGKIKKNLVVAVKPAIGFKGNKVHRRRTGGIILGSDGGGDSA